jgi:hypothetical protein
MVFPINAYAALFISSKSRAMGFLERYRYATNWSVKASALLLVLRLSLVGIAARWCFPNGIEATK